MAPGSSRSCFSLWSWSHLLRVLAPWLHNVPTNPLEQLAGTPERAAIFAVVAIFAGRRARGDAARVPAPPLRTAPGGAGVGVVLLSIGFGLGHVVQGWDAVITTACWERFGRCCTFVGAARSRRW